MIKNKFWITIGCCAALLSTAASSRATSVTGSFTAQYLRNKSSIATYTKPHEYSPLPNAFSFGPADLLYNSRKNVLSFTSDNLFEDDAEGFLRWDHKRDFVFHASEVKIPHYLGTNGAAPLDTERYKVGWDIMLFPQSRNRIFLGESIKDKVGLRDQVDVLGNNVAVDQRNKIDTASWNGMIGTFNFIANMSERTFTSASNTNDSAKENAGMISVRTNPARKQYAEFSYQTSDLKADSRAATIAGKIETTRGGVTFSGDISNRLNFLTSYDVDRKSNTNAAGAVGGYGEKRTTMRLETDYDAGKLDLSFHYNLIRKDLEGASVGAADSNVVGFGADYRRSIFRLKYDYEHTSRDISNMTETTRFDFNQLPGEKQSRGIQISTVGLKRFGLTAFRKQNNQTNQLVNTYGTKNSFTNFTGVTSYLNLTPPGDVTLTLSVFNDQWGISGHTRNVPTGVEVDFGVYETNRSYNLGVTKILDGKNQFTAAAGRSAGSIADTLAQSRTLRDRTYSLSLDHRCNSRTSLEAGLMLERFSDVSDTGVASPYTGTSRQLTLKLTRKF